MRVLAYGRVSTAEQADSRAGLEAQRAAIAGEARRRGWTIIDTIEDAGFSAKDLRRPGITRALEELRRGRADALVVAKLDRLSRSMIDFTGLMGRATREHWALVALDCAVDTSTPSGEAMANMLRFPCALPDQPPLELREGRHPLAGRGLARRGGRGRLGERPTLLDYPAGQQQALPRCEGGVTGEASSGVLLGPDWLEHLSASKGAPQVHRYRAGPSREHVGAPVVHFS